MADGYVMVETLRTFMQVEASVPLGCGDMLSLRIINMLGMMSYFLRDIDQ